MKTLPALLVAVALISPAFSQNAVSDRNTALQEIQKRLKGPVVIPAFKPILLHTGKPITQNDKAQLMVSAAKISAANMPAQKWQKSNIKATETPTVTNAIITPAQMFQGDLVIASADRPESINPGFNELRFFPNVSSFLDIFFAAKANMTYTLSFKVSAPFSNPQYTISSGSPQQVTLSSTQTFTGTDGSSEFAIALVSNNAGTIEVGLFSTNAMWDFESCEIIGTPIN